MNANSSLDRYDLRIIASWIRPGATVLDLGCGEGELLLHLKQTKGVKGTGIEQQEASVAVCVQRGLSVLQGDINREIEDYPDKGFDYVILSRTLQQVYQPDRLIRELLRIGRYGIVSFPNFSHWGIRLQLMFGGYAPVSKQLPYQWFDTPNIRVITIKDFQKFSREVGFHILKEAAINTRRDNRQGVTVTVLPNLRAAYGLFLISDV